MRYGKGGEMYSYIIIDDEAIIRKGLIKKISDIENSPYLCVGEAENGLAGLELVRENNPDIVITDMKMNKMDGVQFLETLRKDGMRQPVIVLSSFKDFKYMHKAIESQVIGYVLKPFSSEEIARQLEKAVREIERHSKIATTEAKMRLLEMEDNNRALQELILGDSYEMSAKEAGRFEQTCLCLISVICRSEDAYKISYSICQEDAGSVKWSVIKNSSAKYQYFILLYTGTEWENYLKWKAEQITKELLMQYEDENIICVISRTAEDIFKLNMLRKENDRALREIYAGETQQVLYSGKESKHNFIYSHECMDEWFNRMRYDTGEIVPVMNRFFENMDISQYTLGDIRKTCEYMVRKVNDYVEMKNIEKDDIMKYFDTRYVFEKDLSRMRREISGYITLIFQSVAEEQEQDLFEVIDSYIQKNYNQKITLSTIAMNIYVTPSVCRNILKENGISFNDYLTKIRMDHAKRLLSDSMLSIEMISGEVGYANPKYFFKVFKKIMGETPQEYRKKGEKANDDSGCTFTFGRGCCF